MIRCTVSVVLALCVLLSQFAAHGHAHCGAQPDGHDLRTHFHAFGHTEHSCAGHDHDEPAFEPFDDHDADANYLSGTDTVPAARAADTLGLEPLWWVALRAPAALEACAVHAALYSQASQPPRQWGQCAPYVRLLTLLI
jgi:hypothetical protein